MTDMADAFREVLDRLQIKYKEKGSRLELCCVFHDDNTPSSAVYKNTGRFFCWSCDLSLNAAQFMARYTGEDEAKLTTQLGEKYGILEVERDPERVYHEQKARLRAERFLMENKPADRKVFGRMMEVLDRIFYLSEADAMPVAQFDKYVEMWYNNVRDGVFLREPHERQSATLGATGIDLDGRGSGGTHEVPRNVGQGVRSLLERKEVDRPDNLRKADAVGASDCSCDEVGFD